MSEADPRSQLACWSTLKPPRVTQPQGLQLNPIAPDFDRSFCSGFIGVDAPRPIIRFRGFTANFQPFGADGPPARPEFFHGTHALTPDTRLSILEAISIINLVMEQVVAGSNPVAPSRK